ncbi:hypothetical protein CCP3SC5AM1_1970007 [Gammaproteobacteria bacterium]
MVKSMWLNVFMVRAPRNYKLRDTIVYHTAYVEFTLFRSYAVEKLRSHSARSEAELQNPSAYYT